MAPTPPPADPTAAPVVTAAALRDVGRIMPLPARLRLADAELLLSRALRVLPGRRLVAESLLGDQPVLAKLFLGRGSRRYRARERAGIEAMQAAGIPTPRLIGSGDLSGGGHYLLTEYLAGAKSLAELQAAGKLTSALLAETTYLLAQLHEAGLEQTDLHLGNLLLHEQTLYLIDGDGIRVRRGPLAERRARRNLAQLLVLLPEAVAVQPLIDSYRAQRRSLRSGDARILATAARLRARRLAAQLDKCFRECSRFRVEKHDGRFVVSLRSAADRLASLLADPDSYLADRRDCVVTESAGRSRLREHTGTLIIERFTQRRLPELAWWRRSPAAQAWRTANRDWLLGSATRLPLALIEIRVDGNQINGWVVLEERQPLTYTPEHGAAQDPS